MGHRGVRERGVVTSDSEWCNIRRCAFGDAQVDCANGAVGPACDALPAGAHRQARIPQGRPPSDSRVKICKGRLDAQERCHVAGVCTWE